jgi:hypothetical protein
MKNPTKGSGVVDDIWLNTFAELDDDDPRDPHAEVYSPGWDEIEEANTLLNPDYEGIDRG